MVKDEQECGQHALNSEEMAAQEVVELPPREAMSLITPMVDGSIEVVPPDIVIGREIDYPVGIDPVEYDPAPRPELPPPDVTIQ